MNPEPAIAVEEVFYTLFRFEILYFAGVGSHTYWAILFDRVERRATTTYLDISTIVFLIGFHVIVIFDHCFAVMALKTVVAFKCRRIDLHGLT